MAGDFPARPAQGAERGHEFVDRILHEMIEVDHRRECSLVSCFVVDGWIEMITDDSLAITTAHPIEDAAGVVHDPRQRNMCSEVNDRLSCHSRQTGSYPVFELLPG